MNGSLATASTLPAPCMTIDGAPAHYGPIVSPDTYEVEWRRRTHGRRVRSQAYYFAHYVSVFAESDSGLEIEISALVDLRVGHRATTVEDYRCRVAHGGPELEIAEDVLCEYEQRLIDAAVEWSR